jgi:hemin uptake protein HemP
MTGLSKRPPACLDNVAAREPAATSAVRIKSRDLLQQKREIEIDHEGRIYRLRLTQLNKLILTA